MRGNNLNDFKKAFDNNINNTKDKNKTDSGRRSLRSDAICALCLLHCV